MRAIAAAAGALVVALGALATAGCARSPNRLVGETCTVNGDCRDLCATGGDFPGGFCTTACFDDGDCPGGTVCADVDNGICLFPCDSDDYCAELLGDSSYNCRAADTPDGLVVLACRG
jgi:hypothetical protein